MRQAIINKKSDRWWLYSCIMLFISHGSASYRSVPQRTCYITSFYRGTSKVTKRTHQFTALDCLCIHHLYWPTVLALLWSSLHLINLSDRLRLGSFLNFIGKLVIYLFGPAWKLLKLTHSKSDIWNPESCIKVSEDFEMKKKAGW